MLKNFMWKGAQMLSSGAKVKWSYVCKSTKEGGLGIKPLKVWNKSTMLKHIGAISKKRILCQSNGYMSLSLRIIVSGLCTFLKIHLGL